MRGAGEWVLLQVGWLEGLTREGTFQQRSEGVSLVEEWGGVHSQQRAEQVQRP